MATGNENIMATSQLTTNSAQSWSPDIQAFTPEDVVPDALILKASTVVTQSLEGDAPVARIPWVDDDEADFVAEGAEIDEAEPTLAEVTVPTAKVSQLIRISREQWAQTGAAGLLSTSAQRAIVKRGNEAFIAQAAPTAPAYTPPEGIITQAGIEVEDPISADLDPLALAVALIENNGGNPNVIAINPLAWGDLRTLKTATGSNSALLGAGTDDQDKRLLGVPVVTTPAVPAGKLLVIDRGAIASAVGPVRVARSEHIYFESDSIALRVTWRLGWGVQHPDRIAVVNVGDGDDDGGGGVEG